MATRYWVGGSGNWSSVSTANWAATSGGASGASAPTTTDDVVFDNLSNTGTTIFTVTVTGGAVCQNMSFGSGATALDAVMTLAGSAAWSISGSLTLVSTNLSVTYTGFITFTATTTGKTITTAGQTLNLVTFNGTGGGWTLQDALNLTSGIILTRGSFDTNGMSVTCSSIASSNSNVRTLTLGTSTISLTGVGTIWNTTGIINLTFSGASSTINLTNNTISSRIFTIGSANTLVFGNLGINGATSTSTTTITFGNITFNTISSNKTVAHTLNFSTSGTGNVTNFNITGTAGNVVTLGSNLTPTPFIISKSSGIVSSDYLRIQDSIATGGATWYAGANSTNVSGNTGWIFTAPPAATGNTSSFFLLF
jgi:hypothetical protein